MKKFMAMLISGLIITSMGTVAFADTTTDDIVANRTAVINKALEEGRISQAQADELIEKLMNMDLTKIQERGQNKGERPERQQKEGKGEFRDTYSLEILVELTGLSEAEIEAKQEEGGRNSYKNIAREYEVEEDYMEALREKVEEARQERLDQMLEEGKITQEKYDEIIERHELASEARDILKGATDDLEDVRMEALAAELGLTVDEVEDMRDNKELGAYMKENEVGKEVHEAVMEELKEAKKEIVEEKLSNGEISQDVYDVIMEMLEKAATKRQPREPKEQKGEFKETREFFKSERKAGKPAKNGAEI